MNFFYEPGIIVRMNFSIKTLGCKVNQYEEQVIRENLFKMGLNESLPEEADFFILNTCTVTGKADSKARRIIKQTKNRNPEVKIFVTGCYVVAPEDIKKVESIPEVFRVVPGRDKYSLLKVIRDLITGLNNPLGEFSEGISDFSGHTRVFLKIQDGCDQRCSYCKVTIVRGKSRSKSRYDVVKEFKEIVNNGCREVVLTGICLGLWQGEDKSIFSDLVEELINISGDFRIRLSSIEPNQIDDKLIGLIASSEKLCDHLHIPLQSGSDYLLKQMNRKYSKADFYDLITKIRNSIPLIGITADIIVGFPGEEEKDFNETVNFVKSIKPSRLHVFKYSDRPGTRSYDMYPKVNSLIARDRVQKLIGLGHDLQVEFMNNFSGRELKVLVEEKSEDDFIQGYSSEYILVKVSSRYFLQNAFIRTKALKTDPKGLFLYGEKA